MEDESNKVAVKPARFPDFVTNYGSAYWWQEMIYMGATGEVGNIVMKEGQLFLFRPKAYSGQKIRLSPMINEAYNKWWYDVFESKFFGEPE